MIKLGFTISGQVGVELAVEVGVRGGRVAGGAGIGFGGAGREGDGVVVELVQASDYSVKMELDISFSITVNYCF